MNTHGNISGRGNLTGDSLPLVSDVLRAVVWSIKGILAFVLETSSQRNSAGLTPFLLKRASGNSRTESSLFSGRSQALVPRSSQRQFHTWRLRALAEVEAAARWTPSSG